MKRILGSVDPQAASLTMDWSPLDVDVLWYVFFRCCARRLRVKFVRFMPQQLWRRHI